MQLGAVMDIDFGKVVNLTSFYVYHYSSSYSATGMALETSADGTKWTDWGEVTYSRNRGYYVTLSAPEDVRYMRIRYTSGGYSTQGPEIDGMVFYGN